jgi:hypothetical protein
MMGSTPGKKRVTVATALPAQQAKNRGKVIEFWFFAGT